MHQMKTWISRGRERGQALVLFAAGLAGFLGLVGLSIDVGQIVVTRQDLQKMADAGAFAGAQELPNPGQAKTTAREYINRNGVSSCGEECLKVTTTNEANDTLAVTTKRHVDFKFLKVIGLSGTEVSAKAKITSRWATGYRFDEVDVFPYAVWGGDPATPGCPYGLCPGELTIYRSNSYACDNVDDCQNNPAWDVNSNKFKGYFHHGSDIYQINTHQWQTFSYGGNAEGQQLLAELSRHYHDGTPIILPVIDEARDCGGSGQASCVYPDTGGNVQGVQFRIVAWVAVELTVDPANIPTSQPYVGNIVAHYSSWRGESGGEPPPPEISPRVIRLIE